MGDALLGRARHSTHWNRNCVPFESAAQPQCAASYAISDAQANSLAQKLLEAKSRGQRLRVLEYGRAPSCLAGVGVGVESSRASPPPL